MEQMQTNNNQAPGVDLQKAASAVVRKMWLVILVSVLTAAIVFAVTYFFVTPRYESTAMFYVNNNSFSVGDASFSLSSGDLSTSRNLVESYLVILDTRESLSEVIAYAQADCTCEELREMITASAVNETEIFRVTVSSPDPIQAERLASAVAHVLPARIAGIVDGTSAKVVDAAVIPSEPSSPNFTVNTVVGFLLGFVLIVGVIVLREIFDITIRSGEDLADLSRYPILAAVPDMMGKVKSGYYGEEKPKKRRNKKAEPVGENVPFAAAEAYKRLRTKIQYSFADDQDCHVIGVSSALPGEGKSTTSINLAYVLAQMNKKVLLIDCDLRCPSVAAKLGMEQEHGLSGFLTKQSTIEQVVKQCRLGDDVSFMVVPAGPVPPNPTELLSSVRMESFINLYAKHMDYVILDLPPVEEVSDALATSKLTHGVLLAVRQNYCNRPALENTVRQFEFVGSRILGFLQTCATESGTGYGKAYHKHPHYRGKKA